MKIYTTFNYTSLNLFKVDELIIKYAVDSDSKREMNRYVIRRKFWAQLLPRLENTDLFNNVSPTKDHWLSAGAGLTGISYTLVITKKYVRIELSIHGPKERNKSYFQNQETLQLPAEQRSLLQLSVPQLLLVPDCLA